MSVTAIEAGRSWSEEEWEVRRQLAAVYRIFARMGYDDLIYTHISARVPGPEHHFLINPYGLMYEEVTASNLVKIDLQGNKVDPEVPWDINRAGYIIHSAVHAAIPEARCVVHLHTDQGVAVSAQKEGLLPLSQFNLFQYGGVAYHDFEGPALDPDEQARLVADLGGCRIMILRNHGTLTWGESVAEAFSLMRNLERACRIQVLAQAAGNEALLRLPEEMVERYRMGNRASGTMVEAELAAWMRKLDRESPDYRE